MPSVENSISEMMLEAGCRTMKVGKTHMNNGPKANPTKCDFENLLGFRHHFWDLNLLSDKAVAAYEKKKKREFEKFNQSSDWTGDYIGTGVSGIKLDIRNNSSSDVVYLRILLGNRGNSQQSGGTWFLTQTPVLIPVQSEWTQVFLPLANTDMGKVGNLMGQIGADTYEETCSDIKAIRIMSAFSKFSVIGDEFVGAVGINNVALVPEPSTMPLIGLGSLLIYYGRRHTTRGNFKGALPKVHADAQNTFIHDNRM